MYNDSDLNIDWKLKVEDIILSEKDTFLKQFKHFELKDAFQDIF